LREGDITYLRKVICEIPKLAQAVKCLNDQQDEMPVAVKCVISWAGLERELYSGKVRTTKLLMVGRTTKRMGRRGNTFVLFK
jgi:hypothetical protein